MNIDWSKAPAWADRHGFVGAGLHPIWLNGEQYSYVDCRQGGRSFSFAHQEGFSMYEVTGIDFRPNPNPWNGEGLPPVGTSCEFNRFPKTSEASWVPVQVVAVFVTERLTGPVAIFVPVDGSAQCDQAVAECFRPIRTAEQIAAEEREQAIDDLSSSLRSVDGESIRVMAAHLLSIGYRKQVAK